MGYRQVVASKFWQPKILQSTPFKNSSKFKIKVVLSISALSVCPINHTVLGFINGETKSKIIQILFAGGKSSN